PNDINVKVDIASMAHGLEVRPALIDPFVYREALSIPKKYLLGYFKNEPSGKLILKDLLIDKGYKRDFVYRRKKGFTVNKRKWFEKEGAGSKLLKLEHQEMSSSHKSLLKENFSEQVFMNGDYIDLKWYSLVLFTWLNRNKDVLFN